MADTMPQTHVEQIFMVLDSIVKTNQVHISLNKYAADGGSYMYAQAIQAVGEVLNLRYYQYAGKSWQMTHEYKDEAARKQLLKELLGSIDTDVLDGELTEVTMRFEYNPGSLAPAGHLIWHMGRGRAMLGRLS